MKKRNIWLDCDPGIDDAVAIAMVGANLDKLNILGISTVAGNQTSDKVTKNALRITSFLGMEQIPVVRGAREPLVRPLGIADDVHGNDGLGDCTLPPSDKQEIMENGIVFMKDQIMGLPSGEKVTLVPTGPLTNIALLLKTFPEVKKNIEQIVLMGGSSTGGNVTASAEFNIWVDPDAARIVFKAGVPVVMCGLDITGKCGLNRRQVKNLLTSDNPVKHLYGEMLWFYFDTTECENGEIVCIHDAVTILFLTNPELFKGCYAFVDVDCTEGMNRGRTVCDFREGKDCPPKTTYLLNQVNLPEFQKVLLGNLDKLAEVNYVIHHNSPSQKSYEEDILEKRNDIVAHYRIS